MLTFDQAQQGTHHEGLLGTSARTKDGAGDGVCNDVIEGQLQGMQFDWREDFLAVSSTVPGGKTDYSPTGAPAFAIVANGIGGQASATLAADNAAMIAGFSWDDNLQIGSLRKFVVSHRLEIPVALTTAQFMVIGAVGAVETGVNPGTLAGLRGVFFFLDASMVLKCRIMDGTNDTTYTTGRTLVAATFYWFLVERDQYGAINWYLGEGQGEDGGPVYAFAAPAFLAAQKFQPFAGLGKASGTTEPAFLIDTQKVSAIRSDALVT